MMLLFVDQTFACTLRTIKRMIKSSDDVGHNADFLFGSLRCERYCLKNARLDGEIEITI